MLGDLLDGPMDDPHDCGVVRTSVTATGPPPDKA